MITEPKGYPTMKDSGVPWLGNVPVHWVVNKLRSVLTEATERNRPDLPLLSVVREKGVILRDVTDMDENHNFIPDDLTDYKVVQVGQFAMNKMKAWQGSYGVSQHEGIVSPAYFIFDVRGVSEDYLHAAIRSKVYVPFFAQASDGVRIGQWDLSQARMREIPFLVPSIPEQSAIVRFLDHAERCFHRYIRAKLKLIALLEEQKQAIIHQAVTGHIDVRTGKPYPTYKPSGVEWLGDVPTHWKVRRIKHVAQVLRGKFTHRPRNDPTLYDGPYPFIQTGDVARAEKEITSYRQTLNEQGLSVSRMFPAGTLVMAIAANIGDVAVLGFDACFPDSVVGFVPCNDMERDFLYYIFRVMRPELLREAPVNTQGNLNENRIGSRVITVAPAHEQKLIVQHIQADTFGLNTAINRANREINLLYEYRSRLIADVVTGKLDVRDAAAALPEVDPLASEDTLNDTFGTSAQSDLDGLDATLEETEV